MASNRPPDEDFDFDLDDGEKDFSVLQAEAQKMIADSRLAVMKVEAWEDAEQRLARANEITRWKQPPDDPPAEQKPGN